MFPHLVCVVQGLVPDLEEDWYHSLNIRIVPNVQGWLELDHCVRPPIFTLGSCERFKQVNKDLKLKYELLP